MDAPQSSRCLPFLVASSDDQGTLRFRICEVDSMVATESQKARIERLLAADISIADDGAFVETSDGLSANELKNLYNALSKLDPTGKRIIYSVTQVAGADGLPVYRVSYMLFALRPILPLDSEPEAPLPPLPALTPPEEERTEASAMASNVETEQPARSLRDSLVNLFTSPAKLRGHTPRNRRAPGRHSQDETLHLMANSESRRSLTSSAPSTSSRSISDFRDFLDSSLATPTLVTSKPESTSMGRSPSLPSSTGLLSPSYAPNSRPSMSSLAAPPSSFPAHLTHKSSAASSSSSLTFRKSTTSLVQSPFDNMPGGSSSVYPLYSAPDALYHQVRRPSPAQQQMSGVLRPSNGSLRTTASVESASTIRSPGEVLHEGDEESLSVPIQTAEVSPLHEGAIDVTGVMPRFESLFPMFDRQQSPIHLVAGPTSPTWVGLYIPPGHPFASPNDDPRFVLYGKSLATLIPFNNQYSRDMSRLALTTRRYADGSERASVSTGVSTTVVGGSSTAASTDTVNSDLAMPTLSFNKPMLLAATIERWVGQLTSQLDYEQLLKFFYTYRSYISPFELLHILIYRFHWTLHPSEDEDVVPAGVVIVEPELTHWKEDGPIKRIVRARTLVVLRYWLGTFFVVDFLRNRRLGLTLTNWLNMVSRSRLLDNLPDAKAMLGLVKDLVRQNKIIYYDEGRACTPPEDRLIGEWDGNYVPLTPDLLDTSPVIAMLLADDDPSRTDPRNPDVDIDFTLPLPLIDTANLKPSDDGFHEVDSDEPLPPPLAPYQRAMLRVGNSLPGQMISSMIPHAGKVPLGQAHTLTGLHMVTNAPDATDAQVGTSYISVGRQSRGNKSKVERAVVNTIGRLSQWTHMLNPRSPFGNQPLKIVGQLPRAGSALFGRGDQPASAAAGGIGASGTVGKLTVPGSRYVPFQRSPLRSISMDQDHGEEQQEKEARPSNDSARHREEALIIVPSIDVQPPAVPEEASDAGAALLDITPDVAHAEASEVTSPSAVVDAEFSHPEAVLSSPPPGIFELDAGSDGDMEDAESDYGEVVRIHTAQRGLRHAGPLGIGNGQPLSPFRGRFDARDSTASWASSISSFGQIIQRRSLSEAVKPPPPPGLSPSPSQAPKLPPGLPPGLKGFIEQEDYSSSESEGDDDRDGDAREQRHHKSPAKSNSKVSLRRAYRQAEEEARKLEERRALRGSGALDDDDSPLLAPDEKPRAWHFAPIHKDDEDIEGGDAETALRRLEGAVDPEIQRAKEEKLQAMLKRARERRQAVEAGVDFTEADQVADADFLAWLEEDEAMQQQIAAENAVEETPVVDSRDTEVPDEPAAETTELDAEAVVDEPAVPPEEQDPSLHSEAVEAQASVAVPTDDSPAPEIRMGPEAPVFELEFPPERTTTQMQLERFPAPGPQSGWLPIYEVPGPHDAPVLTHKRSWIMDYRSDVMARHFSIIDRDLMKNLQFDQIVSLEWARPVPEITVYDWAWFSKWDREKRVALKDAPYRNIPCMSSVSACRARFNLVLMWTATEIVLTPPGDRPALVDKFIRLASKLHQQNSFASLVAIMLGLQSQPVARAMRRYWHRTGKWENRMLKELIEFTAPAGNYRKIRETIAQLVKGRATPHATANPVENEGETVLENAKPSCIPFIHAYLGELHDHSLLPDFIDPTACNVPYLSGNKLQEPTLFNSLPRLPDEVPLRPHVNVGKQRLIADVVRDIVAGQQLALNYTLADIVGEVFLKCLTLQALAPEQLDDLTSRM